MLEVKSVGDMVGMLLSLKDMKVSGRYGMTILKRNKYPFKTTRKTVADWSPIKTGYI